MTNTEAKGQANAEAEAEAELRAKVGNAIADIWMNSPPALLADAALAAIGPAPPAPSGKEQGGG